MAANLALRDSKLVCPRCLCLGQRGQLSSNLIKLCGLRGDGCGLLLLALLGLARQGLPLQLQFAALPARTRRQTVKAQRTGAEAVKAQREV